MAVEKDNPIEKKMNFKKIIGFLFIVFVLFLQNADSQVRFAMIGDYGCDEPEELAVSIVVKKSNPDFIVTTGDNNYYFSYYGDSIDYNIGRYYQEYIKPYVGMFGSGSPDVNRFFPAMGNHDFYDAVYYSPDDIRYAGINYYKFFLLTDTSIHKGNRPDAWIPEGIRYYAFTKGNVQFFILNSGGGPFDHKKFFYTEPDGIDSNSYQAQWCKRQMLNSSAKWKIVVIHHPPYASIDPLYTDAFDLLRWNFKQWGADAVISGHYHTYETLIIDGLLYIVDGLGGEEKRKGIETNYYPGTRFQYNEKFGFLLGQSYSDSLNFQFINTDNQVIDSYTLF